MLERIIKSTGIYGIDVASKNLPKLVPGYSVINSALHPEETVTYFKAN
jgi:hypothetical protein